MDISLIDVGELAAVAVGLVLAFVYALRVLTQNQVVLAQNINKEIDLRRESEDARIAAIQARNEMQSQFERNEIKLEMRVAALTTEIANANRDITAAMVEVNRLKLVNLDMDTAVKQLGDKLSESDNLRRALQAENETIRAESDSQRKTLQAETETLRETIKRFERRIAELEKMEVEFNQMKKDRELEKRERAADQQVIAELRRENATLKARLDDFIDMKALEERPVSKPPNDPMIIEGQFKAESPNDGSAA